MADSAFEQLRGSNDPAVIQRLSQSINGYLLSAFGLLSPEEQLLHKPEFLASLDLLDTTVTTRLNDIAAAIGAETTTPFAAIQTALDNTAGHLDTASASLASSGAVMDAAVTRFASYIDKLTTTGITIQVNGASTSAVGA